MYKGEVNVAQEELPGLLKVAELLRVKGLVEEEREKLISSNFNVPREGKVFKVGESRVRRPSPPPVFFGRRKGRPRRARPGRLQGERRLGPRQQGLRPGRAARQRQREGKGPGPRSGSGPGPRKRTGTGTRAPPREGAERRRRSQQRESPVDVVGGAADGATLHVHPAAGVVALHVPVARDVPRIATRVSCRRRRKRRRAG